MSREQGAPRQRDPSASEQTSAAAQSQQTVQKLTAMQARLRWKQLHEDSYIIYRNLTFDILCSSQNVHLLAASHHFA